MSTSIHLSSNAQRVLELLTLVPRGRVMTYGQLASWSSIKSPRTIGQILHRNPWPVQVPCHRIVASTGYLYGFAFGLEIKRELLESEGVEISAKGRIDLKRFGWSPDLDQLLANPFLSEGSLKIELPTASTRHLFDKQNLTNPIHE